jgi:hypothetical protein
MTVPDFRGRELEISEVDHRALASTASLRERLAAAEEVDNDVLYLAAALGRLLAQEGASPTLAATVLEGLSELPSAPVLRATLFEAFMTTSREVWSASARSAWEFPGCAVHLGEGVFAVAAGLDEVDEGELAEWADRVASGLLKAKAREVVLSGREPARTKLAESLGLIGIVCRADPGPAAQASTKRWRWPWEK